MSGKQGLRWGFFSEEGSEEEGAREADKKQSR